MKLPIMRNTMNRPNKNSLINTNKNNSKQNNNKLILHLIKKSLLLKIRISKQIKLRNRIILTNQIMGEDFLVKLKVYFHDKLRVNLYIHYLMFLCLIFDVYITLPFLSPKIIDGILSICL